MSLYHQLFIYSWVSWTAYVTKSLNQVVDQQVVNKSSQRQMQKLMNTLTSLAAVRTALQQQTLIHVPQAKQSVPAAKRDLSHHK